MEDKNNVKLVVKCSECEYYKAGDEIVFDGPVIDKGKSGNICMMALNALFPYVYAARKGFVNDAVIQCPDCAEKVEFTVQKQ